MIDGIILLLAVVGFFLLFAASSRHQHDWLGLRLSRAMCRMLRFAGFASLAIGYAIAGVWLGWGYGAVAWLGWLTIAAALVVAVHTSRTRILERMKR